MPLLKLLAYVVFLCFERRLPKHNSAIRLMLNIMALQKFWVGHAAGVTEEFFFSHRSICSKTQLQA